ncbi:DEAD/DEAH box helicase [Deinococcus aquaticus]|uniref:DEAD/DEAH box helicase n=1 Tax=Deinococcus aquaticus TaxID=328692 RepID=UPI003F4461A6
MTSERDIAVFAFKVGWEPKGWLPDRPWVGVPTYLRYALTALAARADMPTRRVESNDFTFEQATPELGEQLAFWPDAAQQAFGTLHPMSPEAGHTLQRVSLAFLERVLSGPEGLSAVPGDPLQWRLNGRPVTFSAEDLLSPGLPRGVQTQVKTAGAARRPKAAPGEHWLTVAPLQLRLWSMAWLSRLQQAIAGGHTRFRIRMLTTDPLPVLALWDTLELLEATRRLYDLDWQVPQVEIDVPVSPALQTALDAYLGHPDGLYARKPLALLRRTRVVRADVVLGPVDEVDQSERDAHWTADEVYEAARSLQGGVERRFMEYRVAVAEREVLDFMFARYFAHPRLRDEQATAVQRVLEGNALLVLLPTGYGKSVIYQLVGLMQPGTALIVSPLSALIKDQVAHLRRDGIIGAGYVVGNGSLAKQAFDHFENGRYRLFYCAPERFDTVEFKRTVAGLIERRRISLVAVDEAHCVSEWGHDFRPAYMHVRSMRRRLQAETASPVPLLALTATASPVVRADIQRALGIPEDHVVQSRSSDRPELSFSVHRADGRLGREARLEALDQIFTDVAPRLFGNDMLLRTRANGTFENGSIVFTPYVDRRDPKLFGSGTSVVREHLARGVLTAHQIGMYSGTAPGQCPHCGSHNYYRHYGEHRCNACHGTFKKDQIDRTDTWDEELIRTQDDFLSDRLPVLVSTKGFGMGIDKQNIRLVTHYVMSGSLEAYYQEAGRAGRSGEHAHVALVTVPPADACVQAHLKDLPTLMPDQDLPFPCLRRNAKGFPTLDCEYGLRELCDVAQQALFIQENFPSAREDHAALQRIYVTLKTQSRFSPPAGLTDTETVRALTRLVTLGVLSTYVKRGKTFSINTNSEWNAHDALESLERELRGYDQLTGAPPSTLKSVRALSEQADLTRDEYVNRAGRLLIDTLYSTVRTMRLYGLVNLYRFASLPAGTCRRVHLRRSFEVTPLQEDYRCGFCDTCQPDLQFGRTSAHTPVVLTREEELGQTFENLEQHFDAAAVAPFITACAEARVTASFAGRTDYLLEHRPNDLGLLFLNAALHAAQGNVPVARQVTVRAVQVMRRAGQDAAQIHRYLDDLSTWQPDLIPDLCAAVGGPFDDSEGRPLALQVTGLHDEAVAKRLHRSWALQTLRGRAALLLPDAFTQHVPEFA